MPNEESKTINHSAEKVFPDCKLATHMPFFDGKTLLFCQAGEPVEKEIPCGGTIFKAMRQNPGLADRFKDLPTSMPIRYRAWKLAYSDMNSRAIQPISTGLPEDWVECSPAFYREGDRIHLSFIGGGPGAEGMQYRLYTAVGSDLGQLGPITALPHGPVFFGFVSPHHVCWGTGNTINLKEKSTGTTHVFKSEFKRVLRVSFRTDDPAKLLLTGIDGEGVHRTLVSNLADGNSEEVFSGSNAPIYKSSLHGDRAVFARKNSDGVEDRDLCIESYSLAPSRCRLVKP